MDKDKKGGDSVVSRLGVERRVDVVIKKDIPIIEQIDLIQLNEQV